MASMLTVFIILEITSLIIARKTIQNFIKTIIQNFTLKNAKSNKKVKQQKSKNINKKRKRRKKKKNKTFSKKVKVHNNAPVKKQNKKTRHIKYENEDIIIQKSEIKNLQSKEKITNKNFINNINIINNKNEITIYKDSNIKLANKKECYNIKTESIIKYDEIKFQNLNDQELNTLEYEYAIKYDKRTYLQYYWSLLKKKQLILFTFWPTNDYNVMTIKIALFLLSFALYFTINAFFFSDDTMHKIYKDKGNYNLFYQIPQIIISSVVSVVINMILKKLALSENNILAIKSVNNYQKAVEKSKKIEFCIVIKFIVFLILGLIFMLFFFYFISCFCAVYVNTQMILIKNTLLSFILSMIYPFGLNLLPGLIRIPSLRDKNKGKKCLFKISNIIAII